MIKASTPTVTTADADSVLRISIGHNVSAAAGDYVREKIGPALAHACEPVLAARVRLTGHPDPAVARPVVAQANIDMNGRVVRAQIAAATTREAIDLLAARVKTRLDRLARHRDGLRGGRHGLCAHEGRDDDTHRRGIVQSRKAPEARQIVRRKSYALPQQTCEEAAFDMDTMDYGFHLFTESGSGVDSVLYRTGNAEYRLAQLDPRPDAVIPATTVTLSMSPVPAPVLEVSEAVARLELTGWPFVFFRDRATDRGSVLYHRYNDDYGLITPPTRG
ncbi:HPF/RaiA family ribosome-associated protein [Nocardia amikacinitolerans]|uniref:ribosome hibernation promotion factor n=1 Tax=Nocardia amikacinitolerans TaxID=756689 RepID=UPI00367391B1